jgi:hypothetical protein
MFLKRSLGSIAAYLMICAEMSPVTLRVRVWPGMISTSSMGTSTARFLVPTLTVGRKGNCRAW